jgi:hypothetical protein
MGHRGPDATSSSGMKVRNAGGKQPTLDERPQDVGMASDQPTVSSRINI